jgi:hypothetical protein
MSNQDNAFKKGMTPWCRRCLIRRANQGFPPVLKEGQHKYCHKGATKEETTLVGITVVRFKQSFHPGTSVSPKIHQKGTSLSHPWLHR